MNVYCNLIKSRMQFFGSCTEMSIAANLTKVIIYI